MSDATEIRLLATIHDLETRLEIALLCANQVWWEWDVPSGILKTHATKDCILGYDLGRIRHHLDFWMDALPPEERESVWQSLQEHLAGKTEMWVMEHRYRDPEGVYKWVLEAGKVISFNPDGSPLRMVGITQNIHEKKEKDEELRKRNEELTAALKLKDLVLAGASHDMKNTLNSGCMIAELLSQEAIGRTAEFRMVEESLRKSLGLVSSIHELAHGNLTAPDRSQIDLKAIMAESRDFHAPVAQSKGLGLQVEANEGNSVLTDGLALRRIIDNLVGNAIKFTDTGVITISDRSTDAVVCIEVSDTGVGVPAENAHDLFTPFKKLSDRKEGSGLGLSISRDLAEKLSGILTYRPNTPRGSIFRLEIPRVS